MTDAQRPGSKPLARADYWNKWDDDYELVLACGGDGEDDHMVPMEMNMDAATPHGECPVCGNIAFLHNQVVGGDA